MCVNLSYEDLVKEWLAYYQNLYSAQDINRTPPQGTLLNPRNKPDGPIPSSRSVPTGNTLHELPGPGNLQGFP